MIPMRYKVGDPVIVMVERGIAKEGDVGVIDAVHKDCYTVGFYATEDALIGNGKYYEDELRPQLEKEEESSFRKGEKVLTLKEVATYPAGLVGIVIDVYPNKKALAVQGIKEGEEFPAVLPYLEEDVQKLS